MEEPLTEDEMSEKQAKTWRIATEINIDESFNFLQSLFEKKKVSIISPFPTLNGLDCVIEKGDRCFTFSTGTLLDCSHPVQYQDEGYGLKKPFDLKYNDAIYHIKNGPGKCNIHVGKGLTTDGEIFELESPASDKSLYYRAIFPMNMYGQWPLHFIESGPFKTKTSLRVLGYVTLVIGEYKFGFYDYDYDEKRYLFIDCVSVIQKTKFEEIVEAISFSFGIVCGHVQRDEVYILASDNPSFSNTLEFEIKKLLDSCTGWHTISPKDHKDYFKLPSRQYMPAQIFCNLVQQCMNDKRLLRAIRILTESFDRPYEIMASTFSVCLETIKNIVIAKNEHRINPFKDKSLARTTINDIKNRIQALDAHNFNNKEAVLKKIEQLNQVGNADSFFLLFELLGIVLNEDDRNCINKRNDFLHGRIPFEDEGGQVQITELRHIVCKLHFLITSAILKYVGYSGPVLNNPKMNDIVFLKRGLEEPVFRII